MAAAVGYSVSFVSALEQNRRLPAVAVVLQQFIPALGLQEETGFATHLVELAAQARGERLPATITVQRTAQLTVTETFTLQSSHLPASPTELIGREQEVKALCNRLQGHSGRLLTLVGPPGVGKTQLGLQVARRLEPIFSDGARFVPLAAVSDPELVATTLATELGLVDTGKLSPQDRLIQGLRQREVLLVLDNFEQILGAAPLLATLLAACPRLYLLVTSRERLHVRAEQRFPVPALDLAFAVTLFVQRAQAIDPTFEPTITSPLILQEICQRLDCLPLAIELIAVHIDLFSPKMMLTRLKDRSLDLLEQGPHDAPERHRTLRKAIHRSYTLFGPEEQRLFRALGVFVSGFDLEAVVGLGYAEQTLQALVNRSMVRIELHPDGVRRGRLLETLREYAREQLVIHQELPAVQQQHAEYFIQYAESHRQVDTPQTQRSWLNSLDRNVDNLQAAFTWALEQRAVEPTLRLMVALQPFWFERELQSWARRLYQAGIRLADQEWTFVQTALNVCLDPTLQPQIDLLAHALLCAGEIAARRPWDIQASMQLLERSEQLDKLTGVKAVTLFTLLARVGLERLTDNLAGMAVRAHQILTLLPSASDLNEWNHKWLKVTALQRLSVCAMDLGDRPQLAALTEQMVPLFEELGDQEALVCLFLNQGDAALYAGDIKQAAVFLQRSLTYGTGQGTFFEQCAKHKLGIVALHNGEPEKARVGYIGWIKFLQANYGFWNVAEGLWGLANLANY